MVVPVVRRAAVCRWWLNPAPKSIEASERTSRFARHGMSYSDTRDANSARISKIFARFETSIWIDLVRGLFLAATILVAFGNCALSATNKIPRTQGSEILSAGRGRAMANASVFAVAVCLAGVFAAALLALLCIFASAFTRPFLMTLSSTRHRDMPPSKEKNR